MSVTTRIRVVVSLALLQELRECRAALKRSRGKAITNCPELDSLLLQVQDALPPVQLPEPPPP